MLGKTTTVEASPNIALVKYMGRRGPGNLPENSSVSITLDESLHVRTSVLFDQRLKEDALFIDGTKQDLKDPKNEKNRFIPNALDFLRGKAGIKTRALISSESHMPKAAGVASSAAGGAAIAYAGAVAAGLELSQEQISIGARLVSGSASRSMFGGFVIWDKGERTDGLDSYARQLADKSYWPEVIDVVGIVSSSKKKVSSGEAHDHVKTSELYKERPEIAERHVGRLVDAIQRRDFQTLAEVTMADSNSMHGVFFDSQPPIIYLNDRSFATIDAINELNRREGGLVAAYTFDAGPNPQVITLERYREKVVDALKGVEGMERVMVARQGSGPKLLGEKDSLIDESTLGPTMATA